MLYRDILIIRRSKSVKHIASRHKDLKRFLMIYSAVERVSKIEIRHYGKKKMISFFFLFVGFIKLTTNKLKLSSFKE